MPLTSKDYLHADSSSGATPDRIRATVPRISQDYLPTDISTSATPKRARGIPPPIKNMIIPDLSRKNVYTRSMRERDEIAAKQQKIARLLEEASLASRKLEKETDKQRRESLEQSERIDQNEQSENIEQVDQNEQTKQGAQAQDNVFTELTQQNKQDALLDFMVNIDKLLKTISIAG